MKKIMSTDTDSDKAFAQQVGVFPRLCEKVMTDPYALQVESLPQGRKSHDRPFAPQVRALRSFIRLKLKGPFLNVEKIVGSGCLTQMFGKSHDRPLLSREVMNLSE